LDLFAIGRDYVKQRAKKIDPAQIDIAGSDVNLIVGSNSMMGAHVVRHLGFSVSKQFLDGVEDDEDLDRLAWDKYQLTRKGASPAKTTLTLERPNALAGGGDIAIGTKVGTLGGIEYVTTQTATFGASATKADVRVRAAQAGKATQVAENTIAKFSNPQQLFDPTITIASHPAAAGGEEREDNDTFKARIRSFWRNARRGTLGAIEFGALTVPGVVSAQAIEALDANGRPARIVALYISDSSGVASDALAAEVDVALNEYRAGGITVLIFTSAPTIVDVTLKLRFDANVDTAGLSENIRTAVYEFINSLPVNGTLYRGELASVLQRYVPDGLIPSNDSILVPAGDLVPSVGQTLRTTLANIVVT
jgi:hypothetical protein